MTDIPPFRQSLAKVLLEYPPCELRKRLDEDKERKQTDAMRRGTLVDRMVYPDGPGGQELVVLPHADWRSKEAKVARAGAAAHGKMAVLLKEVEECMPLVEAIHETYADVGVAPGAQETLTWTVDGVECQGTPDTYCAEKKWLIDLKTTDAMHNPTALLRWHIKKYGWHIQAAAYREATGAERCSLLLACPKTCLTRWVHFSEELLAEGYADWCKARAIWNECWMTGEWPGYEDTTL